MEWSLQTRDIEKDIVPTARELGVAIVAYSPLGRGLLSNTFKVTACKQQEVGLTLSVVLQSRSDIKENDWRRFNPRFSEGQTCLDLWRNGKGQSREGGC